MSNSVRRDFFISFNSADLVYAKAIDDALRMGGFTTYYHPRDLAIGGNIAIWMDDALMNSVQTLALYSPAYTSDKAIYSKAERYATWWQDPGSDKRKLIPILLADTAFTPLMAPIKRIDARGKTPSDAAAFVVAQLNTGEEPSRRDLWRRGMPLPAIFQAAYRPNPNFTGRFEALELLQRLLRAGTNAAITAVAGLGGIGKTTLAAEYCHRFGGLYAGVWWIRAEQELVMLQDIATLGSHLSLQQSGNIEKDARACLDYLATRAEPWLLVYDNAPNPDAVQKWLPIGGVRCLITSRFTEFGDVAAVTRLDQWSVETTQGYLLARVPRNDEPGARRLSIALDGLPLAAEQAAAFLSARDAISFDEYTSDLARLIKLPRQPGSRGSYPDTVYAAFVKSLAALEGMPAGSFALNILCLCAYLSPDGVALDILLGDAAIALFPEDFRAIVTDKFLRSEALASLSRLSLSRRAESASISQTAFHRLLLEVVRDWMAPETRDHWHSIALELVARRFPQDADSPASWPICALLLPNVAPLEQHSTT